MGSMLLQQNGASATGNSGRSYEHDVRVTFCMTNAEGNVNHHEYAWLFGMVRELFALDYIPDFRTEAGREYLLKTRSAAYEYVKDFYFGDVIR